MRKRPAIRRRPPGEEAPPGAAARPHEEQGRPLQKVNGIVVHLMANAGDAFDDAPQSHPKFVVGPAKPEPFAIEDGVSKRLKQFACRRPNNGKIREDRGLIITGFIRKMTVPETSIVEK